MMTHDMKTILMVEDNPGDVYLFQEILKRYRPGAFRLVSTDRLDDGLFLLEKEKVDLIILDMNLPDSCGMETVHAVKEKVPDVALVVVTGDEDEQLGIEAVKNGAQDFLVKGKVPSFVLIRVIDYAMERQASERRLRESEMFLRSTLDALTSHIAIIDDRGTIVAVNKAWEHFAYDNQADLSKVCVGANYFAACSEIHGDDAVYATAFLGGMKSVLSGKSESFSMEYPCHSPLEKRWFFCRVTPFPTPGLPFLVVSHANITERKLAEEALKNSEIKMRTILDALTLQIVFIDLDYRIIWANQALCDYVRSDRDTVIGRSCYDFWQDQHEQCADCDVEQALTERRPVITTKKTADGKIWKVIGCPVMDQDGRITSMVKVREDITEKVSIEEQLHHAQKMDAVGRLAGGVAHDFNNMLSIIIGFAELSRGCMDSGNPLSENLSEILYAARRSADLTRHLLAFARKQPVTPKILDLNLIVENSRKMLQRLVGEDIDIRFIPAESVWSLFMDPAQVDQILTNLAVNARDAIAGTGVIVIETRNIVLDDAYCKTHVYAKPGLYVMIQFSDTGKGMDAETKSRVFEPFFTTKPLGEGTGLGLSTVFGIIKQNNGLINVYSEPGHGTTFRLYLPRHRDQVVLDDNEMLDVYPRGHETLLVVEDEKKILKLCKHLLRDLGYRVFCFSSPNKAIGYLERYDWPFSLLLSDVVMPGMNGEELRIRVARKRPGIRTLFMSGYTHNIITQRGGLSDETDFIEKPFTTLELATKIRAVLDKYKPT